MGAFGAGTSDNDDALDFLEVLVESDDSGTLIAALDEALAADYLEMPEASAALVAAEALAAKNLRPVGDLPPDLAAWVQRSRFLLTEPLLSKAIKAVSRVGSDSELNDEWSASDAPGEWHAALSDLKERLDAS
ncbi:MAG: DUF4259 domain-containing protein [Pseudomonadota bacterium]